MPKRVNKASNQDCCSKELTESVRATASRVNKKVDPTCQLQKRPLPPEMAYADYAIYHLGDWRVIETFRVRYPGYDQDEVIKAIIECGKRLVMLRTTVGKQRLRGMVERGGSERLATTKETT